MIRDYDYEWKLPILTFINYFMLYHRYEINKPLLGQTEFDLEYIEIQGGMFCHCN